MKITIDTHEIFEFVVHVFFAVIGAVILWSLIYVPFLIVGEIFPKIEDSIDNIFNSFTFLKGSALVAVYLLSSFRDFDAHTFYISLGGCVIWYVCHILSLIVNAEAFVPDGFFYLAYIAIAIVLFLRFKSCGDIFPWD